MKRTTTYLAVLISFFITCNASCKKDAGGPPPDTRLEITVTDETGSKVSGATVALLDETGAEQIGESQTTDAKGVVTFLSLEPKKYTFGVVKGCRNNANGTLLTSAALSLYALNKISTVISPTGTLNLVNNSSNPYHIFINGLLVISAMPGGTTEQLPFKPSGPYTIRVVQVSGYVFEPTDITYTGNLQCGGTLTTSFPN